MSLTEKKKYIVITTIYKKSEAIKQFEKYKDWKVIIVGDLKTPNIVQSDNVIFLSIEKQQKYALGKICPVNHYCRKNLGYIYAIENGADVIYDTDDDNFPKDNWSLPKFECSHIVESDFKFVNIYKSFSCKNIWPRGLPLESLHNVHSSQLTENSKKVGVWQGLVDKDPDVDAIYRIINKEETYFDDRESIILPKYKYCPFNSQNTFWNKVLFPLLYLPCTVNFRFTDILRAYIAQRIMWEKDFHLGFTNSTAYQIRNAHNLIKDMEDELFGQKHIHKIIDSIDNLQLTKDINQNLLTIYQCLEKEGYVNKQELVFLENWLKSLENK